ncbi:hypothetical protein BDB00DRAFT_533936 [Zychaea mexicana]|uniref:uncharacterized protein n=1 Tax=Zychaea mexicana TaxID=64656 RepID=UPI0022FED6B2|nr:uncharacterized protein BDB00DRAFT_533936 [Zychaea mexicana]KAI9490748.1 hypothetical protein BDB00DRAFT_533936 [Zychaea mexicana]
MTASKVVQISKEIEDARCKGNWKLIPELARRYRKHNPKGEILAQTISAEASLSQLSYNARKDTTPIKAPEQQYDTLEKPTLPPRLDMSQVKSLQLQLKSVIQMNDDSTNEKEFSKVILARSFFECGEFTKTLDMLQQSSIPKQDTVFGYRSVLLLQACVIKAISFELTGDVSSALESYKGVAIAVNDVAGSKDRVFTEWAEEGLYRAALVALENDTRNVASTLEILRAYQRATAAQPTTWRLQKRLTVTRRSLKYLSETYRRGEYCPPEKESSPSQTLFMVEATQLRTIYESMIHASAVFPRADQVNPIVLEYVDQLAELVDLVAWPICDLRAFAESLNRTTQKAFNSPRIMRHQFHVQVKLGEFKEAHYAFRSYLYLVGLTSQARDESRLHGEALATDTDGNNVPVPLIREEEIRQMISDRGVVDDGEVKPAKSIASKRSVEKESTEDVLKVLLSSIKMLCEELERGAEAVEMAEIAKNVFDMELEPEQQDIWTTLGTRVYRAAGTAYGLLATQTMDPTMRPDYHGKALEYLGKSLEICESWETYYQLALERGETRDIRQAVHAVTRALQLNPRYIASWHLLVLLCTCPAQSDMQQAFRTCETALEKVQDIISEYQENEFSSGELGTRPGFDDFLQYVLLETTQSMLTNVVKGSEDALEAQKDVFGSYNLIALPEDTDMPYVGLYNEGNERNPMVVSGSLGNLSETIASAEADPTEKRIQANGVSTGSLRQQNGSLKHLSEKGSPLNGKANSVRTEPINTAHHRRLHPSLHLFRGRSLRRHKNMSAVPSNDDSDSRESRDSLFTNSNVRASYPMQASNTSLQSATPSFNSTRSLNPRGSITSSSFTQSTARCRLRQKQSTRILCNLWLLSASFFLNMGRIDEALKSVEEAENVDWTSNARLWCMLGRIRLLQNKVDWAITAFQKGLVCESNDIECRVWLAKAYQEQGLLEIAEGILELVTRGNGWSCAEAWFYLGEVYRKTDRTERAKDCLLYALELEKTQPILPFYVLPRCV